MAGIRDDSPPIAALDVLSVLVLDTPAKEIADWQHQEGMALIREQVAAGEAIDRDSWGAAAWQQEATARLMRQQV